MRRYLLPTVAILGLVAGHPGAANAVPMYSSLAAWETAVGSWTETTNLGVADGTIVSSATLNDGTVLGFAQNLNVQSIPSGGWSTWCCGYSGQVLASYATGSWTTENWLITPVTGFGMFLEPDPFQVLDITLSLSSGDHLTQAVDGNSGAAFFGWVGSGVTGLTITSSTDFASGDWFTTGATREVPEPASLALLGTGILGLGLARRCRKAAK